MVASVCVHCAHHARRFRGTRPHPPSIAKADAAALDFSRKDSAGDDDDASDSNAAATSVPSHLIDEQAMQKLRGSSNYDVPEMEESSSTDDASTPASGLFGFFKSLTTQKEITQEALEPVLKTMREHLIHKNVAAEIADSLVKSVATSLVGNSIGTFTSRWLLSCVCMSTKK